MRFGAVLVFIGVVPLVAGCSSEVITLSEAGAPGLRPPGCSETICDVAYERCEAAPAEEDGCTKCKLDCQLESTASGYAACSNSCMYVCSYTGRPSSCTEKLDACRKTSTNTGCVDGMDRQYVPAVVSKWLYDSEWDCAQAACGEFRFRAVCVELAEASVCKR